MGAKSSIEWTDATWNPIRGCSRISEGCLHCYAEGVAARFSGPGQPYEGLALRKKSGPAWTGEVGFVPEHLGDPLRWKRPRRIFVNSMSDLFHEKLSNEQIAAVFGVMTASPQHTFQVLTKRPNRMLKWFEWAAKQVTYSGTEATAAEVMQCIAMDNFGAPISERYNADAPWPLPNVWLGVSTENQEAANERVPLLLQTPAAVRFVSAEPLLGPIDFNNLQDGHTFWTRPAEIEERALDWVIVGGESGPSARPCNVAWIRSIVEQCKAYRVACFVKQLGAKPTGDWSDVEPWPGRLVDRKGGEPNEWPADLRVQQMPVLVSHG